MSYLEKMPEHFVRQRYPLKTSMPQVSPVSLVSEDDEFRDQYSGVSRARDGSDYLIAHESGVGLRAGGRLQTPSTIP